MRVERGLGAALLLAIACVPAGAQAPPGAELLAACAACHGARGAEPLAMTPSLAGQPKLFVETQLVLIREGLRNVPAMKAVLAGMSDETIGALAGYFAAQQPPAAPVAAPRPQALSAAAELVQRGLCGTCHRPDFSGQQQVPRLAGQREDYLLASMKQLRDAPGPGRDTVMAATLRGLSDADLANLAHYLATRP